jgi:hypothetical protein
MSRLNSIGTAGKSAIPDIHELKHILKSQARCLQTKRLARQLEEVVLAARMYREAVSSQSRALHRTESEFMALVVAAKIVLPPLAEPKGDRHKMRGDQLHSEPVSKRSSATSTKEQAEEDWLLSSREGATSTLRRLSVYLCSNLTELRLPRGAWDSEAGFEVALRKIFCVPLAPAADPINKQQQALDFWRVLHVGLAKVCEKHAVFILEPDNWTLATQQSAGLLINAVSSEYEALAACSPKSVGETAVVLLGWHGEKSACSFRATSLSGTELMIRPKPLDELLPLPTASPATLPASP